MNKTTNDTANASSMETLWKVLRFIGKYRFLLILSIILAAVSVILQLYVPVLFGNAIDQVVAEHDVNFSMMWYYLTRILVMVIISSVATWIMNIINNRMYRISAQKRSVRFRYCRSPIWTATAPVTSSAVSLPIPISFPMVFFSDLHSCFPEL